MTEEKAGQDAGRDTGANSGRSRKGRRRYFQPKKDGKSQGQSGQSGQSGAPGQQGQPQRPQDSGSENRRQSGSRSRNKRSDARRRARSRQRYDDTRAANLEAEVAYVAPQSVYIYEHTVHPELRDSYEFRPDHFSKVGRTLADYDLDLSKLFPGEIADDGTPVLTNMLPKPQFDWSAWEDTREDEDQKG